MKCIGFLRPRLVLGSMALTSCVSASQEGSASVSQILGVWKFAEMQHEGATYKGEIIISDIDYTVKLACKFPEESEVTSQATSKIKLTDNRMTILQKRRGEKKTSRGQVCGTGVDAETVEYKVLGQTLILRGLSGEERRYSRTASGFCTSCSMTTQSSP